MGRRKPLLPRPTELEGDAAAEWDRITTVLDETRTLTKADRAGLMMYCRQYAKWMQAEAKILEYGPIVASPKTKTPMINLWATVANQAYDRLAKIIEQFGLTPASRGKIKQAQPDEKELDLEF